LPKPVDEITTDDVVAVLQPIWRSTPETASRLRGRIENILDAAKAAKHIASPWENPARWRGTLNHLPPRRRKKSQVRHHPAMPYEDLPDFFARLRLRPAPAARALEFTILHATRTSETLKMRWKEIDWDEKIWTIPAERMKMGFEHRVPLIGRGFEILQLQARSSNCDPDGYVFQGQKRGMPLSQMSMVLRRMKLGQHTVHGMRSSFQAAEGPSLQSIRWMLLPHSSRLADNTLLADVLGLREPCGRRQLTGFIKSSMQRQLSIAPPLLLPPEDVRDHIRGNIRSSATRSPRFSVG